MKRWMVRTNRCGDVVDALKYHYSYKAANILMELLQEKNPAGKFWLVKRSEEVER